MGNTEISGNTVGRTANKGMEGLAITPDGKMLVWIMQNALIQGGFPCGIEDAVCRPGRVVHDVGGMDGLTANLFTMATIPAED